MPGTVLSVRDVTGVKIDKKPCSFCGVYWGCFGVMVIFFHNLYAGELDGVCKN